MCGISGYVARGKMIQGEIFYEAHCKMSKRGPDDEGFLISDGNRFYPAYGRNSVDGIKHSHDSIRAYTDIKVILGHVRLSVIDLSIRGHQPMFDERAGLAITYNGEIYNYQELRRELESKGYTFCTGSDTEVVLRAYQEWGEEAFNRFNGMWAMGIYDRRKGTLTLSRDRFGIKPLFYRNNKDGLVFASEVKVICSLFHENKINRNSVKKYLESCKLCNNEDTFIEQIFEVPPGHSLTFQNGILKKKYHYWDYVPKIVNMSDEEARNQFSYLFKDSVRLRMRSDVDVGSLLSGGLDSNVIIGTLFKEGLLSEGYESFSSVYTDEKFSEKRYIDVSAKKYGLKSNPIFMTAEKVISVIDKVLDNSEMPIRAVPMILQYLLYQKIRESSNIKVVLNGQGADELFGGYNADYFTRFLQLYYEKRICTLLFEIKCFKENRNATIRQVISGIREKRRIPHDDIELKNVFNKISFDQIVHTPLREYLMYDDRAAMAFGIENRAPFLDYRLVEFAFSIESDLKVNGTENKSIVRHYARGIVPNVIINRKDKMGFLSPQESWQKNEWKSILDEAFRIIRQGGVCGINGEILWREYERYLCGKEEDWTKIWRIFCLYRWEKVALAWNA